MLIDPFAGSGTLGESAILHKRKAILMDSNPDAISTMIKRFSIHDKVDIHLHLKQLDKGENSIIR